MTFSLQKQFPFFNFGNGEATDPEFAHTMVELMDSVGHEIPGDDGKYGGALDKSITAKRKPGYKAKIDTTKLTAAWELLARKTWINLQNINATKKITSLEPLVGLRCVEELILTENLIRDISPLAKLITLRRLSLSGNQVADLTPLLECRELRQLSLADNPIHDFSPLTALPHLNELALSVDQLNAFQRCASLPAMGRLEIRGDGLVPSLLAFPEMPKLCTLRIDNLRSLEGIERFPELLNIHLEGEFTSLSPVSALRQLTHGNFHSSLPLDVTPVSALYALRDLSLHCPAVIALAELSRLPALHDIACWQGAKDSPGLDEFKKTLSTWDHEFLAPAPRHKPNPRLEIVTQAEFDHYDQNAAYGLKPGECNPEMVSSERGWLLDLIRNALGIDLEEETDFDLPWRGGMRRSDTLIIYTLKAYEAFREIVRCVQTILSETQNDWIIYFQSSLWEGPDEPSPEVQDFIVWIYPQKIRATAEHAKIIVPLLTPA